MGIVEHYCNPFSNPFSLLKLALEAACLVSLIILLVLFVFHIRVRNPIFMGKGYHELLFGIIVGVVLYCIEVVDNWIWFTTEFYEGVWKPLKMVLSLVMVALITAGFRRLYKFSDIIFGE